MTLKGSTYTHLVEAAVKDLFDYVSFECDCLEFSFVVTVEERQGFSRVCGGGVLGGGYCFIN